MICEKHNIEMKNDHIDNEGCDLLYYCPQCVVEDGVQPNPILDNWLCNDCRRTAPVPFDCGDGKIRCAGCAVDVYMRDPSPHPTIILRPHSANRTKSWPAKYY